MMQSLRINNQMQCAGRMQVHMHAWDVKDTYMQCLNHSSRSEERHV